MSVPALTALDASAGSNQPFARILVGKRFPQTLWATRASTEAIGAGRDFAPPDLETTRSGQALRDGQANSRLHVDGERHPVATLSDDSKLLSNLQHPPITGRRPHDTSHIRFQALARSTGPVSGPDMPLNCALAGKAWRNWIDTNANPRVRSARKMLFTMER